MIAYQDTKSYALSLDRADVLRHFRSRFYFPRHEGKQAIYFCGNSLGLQPKTVAKALLEEVKQWKNYAVEGHFKGELPWMYYHKFLTEGAAYIAGAKLEEVVVMNTLTTNLHLMMVSFYRPTAQRYKIIMESGAFPSDQYAMESQVRLHGYAPKDAIIEVSPRRGEDTLRTEDILQIVQAHGQSTALVMFGGVNYYTGQFYDLAAITKAAHAQGAYCGFDLAHAAGNVPLQLHEWGPDFAVWCSYKYLNSGPGGPSGVFVHERHADNPALPRFAGWWGHDESERFQMKKGFKPMKGAAGWQLSNAQIFSFAAHKASLDIFQEAGMERLRAKSLMLTGYLEYLLRQKFTGHFHIITPMDADARGCQLSLLTGSNGRKLFDHLSEAGIMCDWREPNVIRLAPVPLYNSFMDVWRLCNVLTKAIAE